MELTVMEQRLIKIFMQLIPVAYLHDYCPLSLHIELTMREERLITFCMYQYDTSDIPGQVLFISSNIQYYTVKLHRTANDQSVAVFVSLYRPLPKCFPVCDRNGEVPRKFVYRIPSGMLSLYSTYQNTIAYENFYLPIHTASFRTSYGK